MSRRHATYSPYEDDHRLDHYIPVYIALPLDVISRDNVLRKRDSVMEQLQKLHYGGVDGVTVYVWWGIVESNGPRQYEWNAYKTLFHLLKRCTLKLQVVLSFHRSGTNMIDLSHVQLPSWIREVGAKNPDIYYRDMAGNPHEEYLSLGVDEKPLFHGRTPIQIYADFMESFRREMDSFLKTGLITDIFVGLGPKGALRYPSHSRDKGWNMPGIGEFQCYDEYMYEDFEKKTNKKWKLPSNAGNYNSYPHDPDDNGKGFFADKANGGYKTEEGKFFLSWYAHRLVEHGDRILCKANEIFQTCRINIASKISLVPWWHQSESRAAELTTGYYDCCAGKAGYEQIIKMFARHHAVLYVSGIELGDDEMPEKTQSGCENLINEIRELALKWGVKVGAQNLFVSDSVETFNRILTNARSFTKLKEEYRNKKLYAMTYVPLLDEMLQEPECEIKDYSYLLMFVRKLHAGQDYTPDMKTYGHKITPLKPSIPKQDMDYGENCKCSFTLGEPQCSSSKKEEKEQEETVENK